MFENIKHNFNISYNRYLLQDGDAGKERFGFYTGALGEALVKDIQELGGILTMEDLQQYQADWNDPINVRFNYSIYYVYKKSFKRLLRISGVCRLDMEILPIIFESSAPSLTDI